MCKRKREREGRNKPPECEIVEKEKREQGRGERERESSKSYDPYASGKGRETGVEETDKQCLYYYHKEKRKNVCFECGRGETSIASGRIDGNIQLFDDEINKKEQQREVWT